MRTSVACSSVISMATGLTGMPTITAAPPGAISFQNVSYDFGEPEHSKATSAPQPPVSSRTRSTRSSLVRSTGIIPGIWAAIASLIADTSEISTLEAPPANAHDAVSMPTVPDPVTTQTSPGLIRALVADHMPTANGSSSAPSPKLTLSGSL